jgi:hypothetical protein
VQTSWQTGRTVSNPLESFFFRVLVSNLTEEQLDRYEIFRRAAFPKAAIKRIVQTITGKKPDDSFLKPIFKPTEKFTPTTKFCAYRKVLCLQKSSRPQKSLRLQKSRFTQAGVRTFDLLIWKQTRSPMCPSAISFRSLSRGATEVLLPVEFNFRYCRFYIKIISILI